MFEHRSSLASPDTIPGATQWSSSHDRVCATNRRGEARCTGADMPPVALEDWPPISQIEVVPSVSGGSVCALLRSGQLWCTPDDDIRGSQSSWTHVRAPPDAVRISGSCLLTSRGGVHCWEEDEAAWIGISRATDVAATTQLARGCVQPEVFVCVARGRSAVKCRRGHTGAWVEIAGTAGATDVVIVPRLGVGCGRWQAGAMACWNLPDHEGRARPEAMPLRIGDVVRMDTQGGSLLAFRNNGCVRRWVSRFGLDLDFAGS